jgi:hypothetical protein
MLRTTLAVVATASAMLLPGAAHAADCAFALDPVSCTPPPPAPVRGLVQILSPCTARNGVGGVLVEAEVNVPFATSVTVRCSGSTVVGAVDETTTTPGQAGVVARLFAGLYGNDVTPRTICTGVAYTYSDGTSGADGIC